MNLRFRSRGIDETRQAGQVLGTAAGSRGFVLALVGPLGAGKTVFVKGLAEGLGVDPSLVSSPTFTIVNEYPAREVARATRLAHVDLYRIEQSAEIDDAGFVDLLEPDAVVAIEWGDRFPNELPKDRLVLEFVRPKGQPEHRQCEAKALGEAAAAVLATWQQALAETGVFDVEA